MKHQDPYIDGSLSSSESPVPWQTRFVGTSPTLIELNPAPRQRLFKSMYRDVRRGQAGYSRYLEAKHLANDTYHCKDYVCDIAVCEEEDNRSFILYTLNAFGRISGTLRICRESGRGLPIATSLPQEFPNFISRGLALAEPGRFAIEPESDVVRRFVSAAYEIGTYLELDAHLLQVRTHHVDFYQRFCNAQLLSSETAPPGCTNLVWWLDQTPQLFFRLFGRNMRDLLTLFNHYGGDL